MGFVGYRAALDQVINQVGVRKTERVLKELVDEWLTTKEPHIEAAIIPVGAFNPPGPSGAPDIDAEDGTLLFGSGQDEVVSAVTRMPFSWIVGTNIEPFIGWAPTDATTGDVVWELSYKAFNTGDPIPATWQNTITVVDSAEGENYRKLSFGEIVPMVLKRGGVIVFKVTRVATDVRDTYTGDARFYGLSGNYVRNRFGLPEEEFENRLSD